MEGKVSHAQGARRFVFVIYLLVGFGAEGASFAGLSSDPASFCSAPEETLCDSKPEAEQIQIQSSIEQVVRDVNDRLKDRTPGLETTEEKYALIEETFLQKWPAGRIELQAKFDDVREALIDAITAHTSLSSEEKSLLIERLRGVEIELASDFAKRDGEISYNVYLNCSSSASSPNAFAFENSDRSENHIVLCPTLLAYLANSTFTRESLWRILAHELGHFADISELHDKSKEWTKCLLGSEPPENFPPSEDAEHRDTFVKEMVADYWAAEAFAARFRFERPTAMNQFDILRNAYSNVCGRNGFFYPTGEYRINSVLGTNASILAGLHCQPRTQYSCSF